MQHVVGLKITDRFCEDYFVYYVIQKRYSRAYKEGEWVKATVRVLDQLSHKEIQLDMTFLRANNIFIPYISPYTPVKYYTKTKRNKLQG